MVKKLMKLIKLDFKRAIINKQFFIILTFGILLTMVHMYIKSFPKYNLYGEASGYYNPFTCWISNGGFDVYSTMFFMALPISATIPYADSYWIDRHSGFTKIVYTKSRKFEYLISKYIVNFIVGGLVVIIPLVFNLYILFMIMPAIKPSVFSNFELAKSMFSYLYYFNPYLYLLAYLFMSFIFGGVYASIGLSVSTFCKNKFLVTAIPTIMYILMFVFEIIGFNQLVPAKFLMASQPEIGTNARYIFIVFIILFVFSISTYIIGVKSDEII